MPERLWAVGNGRLVKIMLLAKLYYAGTGPNPQSLLYRGGAAGPAGPVLAGSLFGRIIYS